MTYDSPKPVKRRHPAVNRLMSPKSSITGLILIVVGAGMLYFKLDTTICITIIGAGMVALGLKDKGK